MGLYDRYVLPRLIELAMDNKDMARQRRRILPAAHGRVLEVGVGSGLNLPFYGDGVTSVTGLDPSQPLLSMARERQGDAPFEIELVEDSAEAMPFDDNGFDCAVMTWTLCSIPDARAALAEIRRVLKPGGELIFIEHGLAPEPGVAAWQGRINPLWRRVGGGCNLNRPIDALVAGAGFALARLERGYMIRGPKLMTYTYEGRAKPA